MNFDNSNLDDTKVYSAMFFNIVVFLIGGVYINSVTVRFIATVLILACIVSMICFKFKVNKTKKNINLFYACFMTAMAVNLCYCSCLFFSISKIGFFIPAVIFVILVPAIAFAMIFSECKKIIKGSHLDKKQGVNPLVTAAAISGAGLGVLCFRFIKDEISEEIVLGFCCGIMGLILAMMSRFFVKWYCHKLLEQRESE